MASSIETFLEAFFGSGNELALPDATHTPGDPLLGELLLEFRNAGSGMLPRVQSGVTVWYALPRTQRERLEQLENVRYATGLPPLRLSSEDPYDARINEFTSGLGFRIRVPTESRAAFREVLRQLRSLRSLRPISSPLELSATRDLLRQLDLAIVARQPEASESLLTALDRGGHLSAVNLSFLKVRRLSGLGLWPELLALAEWRELLAIRRPPLVTDAMLTAVYEQEIRPLEGATTHEVISHFHDHVLPAHGGLFRSGAALRSPQALTMLMLYAVSTEPPDFSLRRELLQKSSSLRASPLLDAVSRLVDSDGQRERPTALDAFRQGRFDESFALAKAEPESRQKAEILLLCAVELQTIVAAAVAVAALAALSEKDRQALLESRIASQSWAALRDLLGEGAHAPTNWDEWLRQLIDGSLKDAVSLAEHGVLEWPFEDLAEDPARIDELATLIASPKPNAAAMVFRSAVPHLLLGLSIVRADRIVLLQPLYDALLVELLTAENIGRGDLEAIRDVLERLFDMGISKNDYRNPVTEAIQRLNTPSARRISLTNLRHRADRLFPPKPFDVWLDLSLAYVDPKRREPLKGIGTLPTDRLIAPGNQAAIARFMPPAKWEEFVRDARRESEMFLRRTRQFRELLANGVEAARSAREFEEFQRRSRLANDDLATEESKLITDTLWESLLEGVSSPRLAPDSVAVAVISAESMPEAP